MGFNSGFKGLRVAVAICHCLIHRPSYTNARATNLKHKTLTDAFKIYVSESKIIRTLGTCIAVGYTAGWAWQNAHGLLLSYHCGAGVTLIIHFCHEFFAINMDTPNFISTKEEQRAVIYFCWLKVYQVSKCIEWCQCSMGTVSCHNGLSVNGARG